MQDNPNDKAHANPVSRLRWACRRGMLELDVILNPFLDTVYPTLPKAEQDAFVALLNCTDPEIYAWLMKRMPVEDKALQHIVQRIHSFMQRER